MARGAAIKAASICHHYSHNTIHLSLCIIGALLAFLPLWIHNHWHLAHFEAMERVEFYQSSSSAALALLVPMVLDTALEFYSNRIRPAAVDVKTPKDVLSIAEKLVLLVGLAIAPCVAEFDMNSLLGVDDTPWSLMYMCCRKSQNILVLGVIMTSLSRYQSQYWHGLTVTVCLLGLVVGQVASLYYNIAVVEGRSSSTEYVTMLFFSILSFSLFYAMTCRWSYSLMRAFLVRRNVLLESFAGDVKADVFADEQSTGIHGSKRSDRPQSEVSAAAQRTAFDLQSHRNVVYVVIYVCLSVMCFTGLMGLMIQSMVNFGVTEANVFGMNVAYIVFEVLLLVYALRKTKFDLIQAL